MTILNRLEDWKDQGVISSEQHALLSGLVRNEPFSLFFELNVLLYAGVVAFIAGLGWTITTWSHRLGDLVVLAVLSAILIGCFRYCFSRAPAWSRARVHSPNLIFDYVLYFGALTWLIELAYFENRLHLTSGQWDVYLFLTAGLFFYLAYRFDNRFVLTLALSSLAGWFGLTISHAASYRDAAYRSYAILYSVVVSSAAVILERRGFKPHFFGTYLNLAANVLFWALLSGVFERQDYVPWFAALVISCCASIQWSLRRRQFSFLAYGAVYGYVGLSAILVRHISSDAAILSYFAFTGLAMLGGLIYLGQRFGRET